MYCAYPWNALRQFLEFFFFFWYYDVSYAWSIGSAGEPAKVQICRYIPRGYDLAIWGDIGLCVLKFSQVTIKIRQVLEIVIHYL